MTEKDSLFASQLKAVETRLTQLSAVVPKPLPAYPGSPKYCWWGNEGLLNCKRWELVLLLSV